VERGAWSVERRAWSEARTVILSEAKDLLLAGARSRSILFGVARAARSRSRSSRWAKRQIPRRFAPRDDIQIPRSTHNAPRSTHSAPRTALHAPRSALHAPIPGTWSHYRTLAESLTNADTSLSNFRPTRSVQSQCGMRLASTTISRDALSYRLKAGFSERQREHK